jgi:hypothetical protein
MIEPTEDDIGRAVVYVPAIGPHKDGNITSLSKRPDTVFVRYKVNGPSIKTYCRDLEWLMPK